MQTQVRRFRMHNLVLAMAGALLAGSAAMAADDSRRAQYERDVAACNSGATGQAREDCLREAGAVLTESRQDSRPSTPEERMRNAQQRCDRLPPGQRQDCLEVMTSQETRVHGSVPGGGVLRERVIQVPATGTSSGAGAPSTVAPSAPGSAMPSAQPQSQPMPSTQPMPQSQPMPSTQPMPPQPAPAQTAPGTGATPLPPPPSSPAPAVPGGPMGDPGGAGSNVR